MGMVLRPLKNNRWGGGGAPRPTSGVRVSLAWISLFVKDDKPPTLIALLKYVFVFAQLMARLRYSAGYLHTFTL